MPAVATHIQSYRCLYGTLRDDLSELSFAEDEWNRRLFEREGIWNDLRHHQNYASAQTTRESGSFLQRGNGRVQGREDDDNIQPVFGFVNPRLAGKSGCWS
jgi:hypothetical protein